MVELVIVSSSSTEESEKDMIVGWRDPELTPEGLEEAREAGRILREHGYVFDLAFTSVLKRAIETLWEILRELDLHWLKVNKSWRLNARNFGQLEGLSYEEISDIYGECQLEEWLTSYDVPVPQLEKSDKRHPSRDYRYHDLIPEEIPSGETLLDTFSRIYPHWDNKIAPMIKIGRKVLVVAHQNSTRGLMTMVENLGPGQVFELEVPRGKPLVYTLDENLNCISKRVLKK